MWEYRAVKTTAGVVAATAGALLVVSLLLPWWGIPPVFLDPPAGAPEEITFAATAFETNGAELEEDGFRYFAAKDLLWLSTGLAGFVFGLLLLIRRSVGWVPGAAVAGLSVISVVLLAAVIASPPDYFELARDELGGQVRGDAAEAVAPMGREPGAFVALVATLALGASAAASALPRG